MSTDLTRYIPADSRHISRLLKAAGLPKSEEKNGQHQTHGWYVHNGSSGGATVSTWFGSWRSADSLERRDKLMAQVREVLEAKGFRLFNSDKVYRPVKDNDDDDHVFWSGAWKMYGPNHACYSLVEVDGALVEADQVPAYKEVREDKEARLKEGIRQSKLARVAEQKQIARRQAALAKVLEDKGIRVYDLREGNVNVTVSWRDLASLLGVE